MRIGYQCKIDAAHRLGNEQMPKDWNAETYGKCCNLHGHTWAIELEVEGNPNKDSGMIINFTELKRIVNELDHRLINDFVALPTAENLVAYFLDKLKDLQIFSVIKVRVYESDHAWAEDIWIMR
jgi:6-pyruvoyltetrahydropterin/6-carboxytetrahydropterin synthase